MIVGVVLRSGLETIIIVRETTQVIKWSDEEERRQWEGGEKDGRGAAN